MMSKQIRYNFCRASFLYNSIQSYRDKVLVLDTRDCDNYAVHRISGSISLSNDQVFEHLKSKDPDATDLSGVTVDLLAELMDEKELEKYNQRRRIFCILVISEDSFPEEFIEKAKKATGADHFMDFYDVAQKHIQDDLKKAIENMEEKDAVSFGLKLYEMLHQDRVRELFILLDGADKFFERYPFMDPSFHPSADAFVRTKSLMAAKLDVTYNFPNDIWESRIFLGSYNQASQEIIVNSLEVTHIVNVTAECKNVYEEKGIKYLHIIILDETEVALTVFFKEVFDFIDNALQADEKNKVLLHCALGKSRSATMTIMFLMKKFSWSYEKALTYVKMKRRIVDPNYGFLRQLEEFEKSEYVFAQ